MPPLQALNLPLFGGRVCLRCLRVDDASSLYAIECDEQVKRYLGGPVSKDRETWTKDLQQGLSTTPVFALALGKDGPLIGRASLHPKDISDELELQIVLGRSAWGHGYGHEAARLLLERADHMQVSVAAIADPRNSASLALLSGLGFQQVETISTTDWQDGHLLFRRNVGGA